MLSVSYSLRPQTSTPRGALLLAPSFSRTGQGGV